MEQDMRWRRLLRPGITAIVGAGGKSTVLAKLVEYGKMMKLPIMVSGTTRMYEKQVEFYKPIYTDNEEEGRAYCAGLIAEGKVGGWFRGIEDDKVVGVEPAWLTAVQQKYPEWYIIAEADGSREKWLKAPGAGEPSVPEETKTTIGVLNLQMLGHSLTPERVYRLEQVMTIMGRREGAVVTPRLLTRLITHPHGMFKGAKGRRILFCTGYNKIQHRMVEVLLDDLTTFGLDEIVLADGYRATCEIRQLIGKDDFQ